MIKQLIPQEVCLKCTGCCRFDRLDSVWVPCFLEGEVQDLLDKKNLSPADISIDKRILPIPNPSGSGFVCAFFNTQENKCKIYDLRPFQCQLYPFLISLRNKRVFLTVDLNCPYVKDNLETKEFRKHTEYLSNFINSPSQLKILKDNPQIIQAYEEVLDVIELKIF